MFEVCKEKMHYNDFAKLMIIIEGLGEVSEDGVPIVGYFDIPQENIEAFNENPSLFSEEYNNEDEYNELLPSLISLAEALPDGHTHKNYEMVEVCKKDEEAVDRLIILGVVVVSLGIYLIFNKKK